MKECKNPTCTAPTKASYCSRQCQLGMRSRTGGKALPDVWISQDTARLLRRRLDDMGLDARDYVVNLIEEDLGVLDQVSTLF